MVSRRSVSLRAYRIADRRHPIFDGSGAFLNGSRWNSKGRRVIYAAQTYAGALLEVMAHSNLGRVPHTHAWIEISAPQEIEVEDIAATDLAGWDAPDLVASRSYGDRWYAERRTAVLLAPSVVTGGVEQNVLINQEHPEFSLISASEPRSVAWDSRLFHWAAKG